MEYYLLAILSSILFCLQFICSKKYQLLNGNKIISSVLFSAIIGLFATIIFLAMNKFTINFTWFSFICSSLNAILNIVCVILAIKCLSKGPVAIYSTFLTLGGMFVPFVYGTTLLNEKVTLFKILASIILVLALAVPLVFNNKKEDKKSNITFFIICFILFVVNGFMNCIVKYHQLGGSKAISSAEYQIIYYGVYFVVSVIVFLFMCIKQKPVNKNNKPLLSLRAIIVGLLFAIFNGMGNFIQLVCASYIDASTLFPLVAGGILIFSAIFGFIFYKEKIQYIQLLLALIATILFVL